MLREARTWGKAGGMNMNIGGVRVAFALLLLVFIVEECVHASLGMAYYSEMNTLQLIGETRKWCHCCMGCLPLHCLSCSA